MTGHGAERKLMLEIGGFRLCPEAVLHEAPRIGGIEWIVLKKLGVVAARPC